jgi:hypothetical protein
MAKLCAIYDILIINEFQLSSSMHNPYVQIYGKRDKSLYFGFLVAMAAS